ncbi:cbb3-type cytochrome c oxidase subunit I [Neobacillus sp. Marseille-QA0830]
MNTSHFFVTGDPMIYGADVSIVLVTIGIIVSLTMLKKWGWLWREWITTVDHKKIGIMYLLAALLMLFRGGVDAILMRIQLAVPNSPFLASDHYNEIFTTHGTIMILFMAMPFMFALFNIVVPLQIGARDVAYPLLNAISFWVFFIGAMLFNISFVIGGSASSGWLSYPPLSETTFSPGPGQNFWIWGIQISGIGSLASGINFAVTILKMRTPSMRLRDMPLFTWSVLASSIAILGAFPILTGTLGMLTIDRLLDGHFFTMTKGGNPMMYINLIWMWGHPEVYIVVLPAFGVFSEVVATFSKKRTFGYSSMVYSMIAIAVVSYYTWAHHFFTMGAGVDVNIAFAICTMIIGIPTGVKVFNWLFTMYRGRIEISQPMLWFLAFVPTFVLGGATGVMLAAAPADYQYHNSYFLIAHFHQVLIGGVVFGYLAGMYYWFPKIFGFELNYTLGKWGFWLWQIGFYVCFMPQYALGFMGMTRRIYIYNQTEGWDMGWAPLNLISSVGALLMGVAFAFQVWQILYSIKYGKRDFTGDPWDGRTLEWSIPSPAPSYNFAIIPEVKGRDAWWYKKQEMQQEGYVQQAPQYEPIHMPKNSGMPFIMSCFFFVAGFGFTFEWHWMGFIGLIGVAISLYARSFQYDTDYYIPVDEIESTERALRNRSTAFQKSSMEETLGR